MNYTLLLFFCRNEQCAAHLLQHIFFESVMAILLVGKHANEKESAPIYPFGLASPCHRIRSFLFFPTTGGGSG
jgi:hypothetical protein